MTLALVQPQPYSPAVALARAGLLSIRAGQYRQSTVLLTRAVELDPNLGEAWRWLGALYSGAQRSICLQWAQRVIPNATIPQLPPPQQPAPQTIARPARRQRRARPLLVATGGLVLASTLTLGGFELAYAERIYPGVQILGQSLSGMSLAEAEALLAPRLQGWAAQQITLQAGEERWTVQFAALADFTPAEIAARAYEFGRSGTMTERLTDQGGALLSEDALASLSLDEQALQRLWVKLNQQIARTPQNAGFAINPNGAWSIVPEQPGRELDQAAAAELLRQAWTAIRWADQPAGVIIDLPIKPLAPARTAALLQPALPTLQRQIAAPLRLVADGAEWTINRAELLDLAVLPASGAPFPARQAAVQALVERIDSDFQQPAVRSRLVREGNRASSWTLGQAGRRLDRSAAQASIMAALETGHAADLRLPTISEAPAPGDLEALGITGIVGRGHSQFASYSSPNRDTNVIVGGQEFHGLLILPGEVISFNQIVGEITVAKGYQMGEMIAGGVIMPSYGGGICQVSTTFFRAAFWAGLEIEERHNHAWRLDWYEVDAPPGMDATIALGGPDLKIRNTTSGYLLVEVITDLATKTQTFTLYGAPTDHKVELVGPAWEAGALIIGRRISNQGLLTKEDRFVSYYSQ